MRDAWFLIGHSFGIWPSDFVLSPEWLVGCYGAPCPLMKRFRFTLAALHVVRQRQEQEATELYAKALLERQKARDQLEVLGREQDMQAEETRREMSAGCPADRLRQRQVFHETLRQAILALEQAVSCA